MKSKQYAILVLGLLGSLLVCGCTLKAGLNNNNMSNNNNIASSNLSGIDTLTPFEKAIAKKLMLSIRYFCENPEFEVGDHSADYKKRCLEPVLKLPPALAQFFSQIELAGVVLFAENIDSVKQTQKLTSDLQKASRKAGSTNFLIGVDQEGGRVVRLPRDIATSFSGNMAIGATYEQFGDQFATTVGNIIGKELALLGINLNFSPAIDVNNNPDNPVINIRSFGEDPDRVSELGLAMMNSLQSQNVMATLKHFPGHGNTHVDSHTGLPSVDFSKCLMDEVELAPFKYAIENGHPAMVMTAHIQYPQIDANEIKNKHGEKIIVPATMSRKLMTDILKDELGFNGVVISDAMNMAGISANFELAEATALSFLAGVDISLMAYPIRNQQDIDGFVPFVKKVAKLMKQSSHEFSSEDALLDYVKQSVATIESTKNRFNSIVQSNDDSKWLTNKYRKLEQTLAEKSISALKFDSQLLPTNLNEKETSFHILVRNNDQKDVVKNAFEEFSNIDNKNHKLSFTLLDEVALTPLSLKNDIQHLIVFEQNGSVNAVDIGEAGDEILKPKEKELPAEERKKIIDTYIELAEKNSAAITLVAAQSPYDVIPFLKDSYQRNINNILIAYDASVYWDAKRNKKVGKGFRAVISTILGHTEVQGKLPIKL